MTGPIVFLGGVLLPSQKKLIERESIGAITNSVDVFQKDLLKGLSLGSDGEVRLVNLPFVGSYPKRYRRPYFPGTGDETLGTVKVRGHGFLNVTAIKFPARFLSACRGLRLAARGKPCVLVVFSANLSFLGSALLHRFWRKGTRICLVLPDLPEFTGVQGTAHRLLNGIESAVFYALARKADCFVVMADEMVARLGVDPARCVRVEGMYDDAARAPPQSGVRHEGDGRIFLYSGSLAARHGIGDLLEAFAAIDDPDARLWICGSGDTGGAVGDLARRDRRVRYFGEVPREKVLALQREASVMVNPRPPFEEFTKYSFPYKSMEYLASGHPVVMHRLPAVPEEYLPYIVVPPTPDAAGLAETMRRMIAAPDAELAALGEAGRRFVMTQKTPAAHGARILDLIRSGVTRKGLPGAT